MVQCGAAWREQIAGLSIQMHGHQIVCGKGQVVQIANQSGWLCADHLPLFAKGHTIDLSPIFGPRINLIQDALEGDFAFSHTDDVNVWIVDIAVGEICEMTSPCDGDGFWSSLLTKFKKSKRF